MEMKHYANKKSIKGNESIFIIFLVENKKTIF